MHLCAYVLYSLFMATGNLVPHVLQLRVISLCTMHPPNMQTEIVDKR